MKALTNRCQVVCAALSRKHPSRLPCFPLVDVAYASAHAGVPMSRVQLDPDLHASALGQCLRELPIDGVYINLSLDSQQADSATWSGDVFHARLDHCLDVQIPANDVLSIEHTEIETLEDQRIETAALFHPGMLATYRRLQAKGTDAAIAVGLTGTFSQVAFLFGVQRLLLALVDDPAGVQRALRRRQDVVLAQVKELCDAGARLIWIGEGVASGTLLGPRMYEQFVLPYEQEVIQEIHRRGALCLLHICGNTTPMLPLLACSGADGCDVDSLTDWPRAVGVLGSRTAIKGNLNPLLFLPGQPSALEEACRRSIREAKGTPGFILSTGCLVPRDSDPASFEVCTKACGHG